MIDPQRLIDDLVAAGWTVTGQGRDYTRLGWPGRRPGFLLVPTDPAASDYQTWADRLHAELEAAVDTGVKAAHALAGQVAPYSARVQGRLNRRHGP